MKRTVIHKGSPEVVGGVVARLRAEGVDAEAGQPPNLIARLIAFGSYRVDVSVPDEEVEAGRRVLAEWDARAAGDVRALAGALGRQVLLALVPTALGAAWALTREPGERLRLAVYVVPTVFLAAFLALSVLQRLRQAR